MKERLSGADFIRAISAIGIVTFHFSCTIVEYNSGDFLPLYNTANGSWGFIFVTIFFILSGAMLYYNYPKITSLRQFYYKRWLSVFPMFYIAFLLFHLNHVIQSHSFFYLGHPFKFILSILGMDGYFLYLGPNYNLIGEWFLGAIILLYILYPVLLKLINHPAITSILLTALWILQVNTTIFKIHNTRNLISCIISFYFGMMFMKYYNTIYKIMSKLYVLILSSLICLTIIFIPLPIPINFTLHVLGALLFMLLFRVGNLVMRFSTFNFCISKTSTLSYAIFLLHHRLLYKILAPFHNLNILTTILLLLATYIICFIASYILYYVNKKICKFFRKCS